MFNCYSLTWKPPLWNHQPILLGNCLGGGDGGRENAAEETDQETSTGGEAVCNISPKQNKIISNISLACFYNTPHNHPEPFLVIPSSVNGFFFSVFSFQADCHFQASRLRIAQKIFSGIMLMPSCRFCANFIMVQGDGKQQTLHCVETIFGQTCQKHVCFLFFLFSEWPFPIPHLTFEKGERDSTCDGSLTIYNPPSTEACSFLTAFTTYGKAILRA